MTDTSEERDTRSRPVTSPAVVLFSTALFMLLAIGAAVDGGALLLKWDEPVQRAFVDVRATWLTVLFEVFNMLGATVVVFSVALVLLLTVVWRRSVSLAWVLVGATLLRPPVEWLLKDIIGRSRPRIDPITVAHGPSFPSGHVLAAVAFWALLPRIVSLLSDRKLWRRLSVWTSGTVIVMVALGRVYLGAHWLSDVVGGLLLLPLYILTVDRMMTARWIPSTSTRAITGPPQPPSLSQTPVEAAPVRREAIARVPRVGP